MWSLDGLEMENIVTSNENPTTNNLASLEDRFRPFVCNVCKKRFKLSHHLKQHYRTHTGERPFVCLNCGRGFSQYSSHMYHVKRCSVYNSNISIEHSTSAFD